MQGTIVFVGAGGAGVSNLVGILHDLGYTNLIGINKEQSQITQALEQQGVRIFPHGEYQVQADDVMIYSSAAEGSSEVQEAFRLRKEAHKPLMIWNYFEFLGEMSKYFRTIGFAGTNGKSSSSAMGIFAAKQVLPDFGIGIVGALVPDFGGKSYVLGGDKQENRKTGEQKGDEVSLHQDLRQIFEYIFSGKKLDYSLVKKYWFLVEACEYQRHLLHLDLEEVIITNMELDHTDYFRDWQDYQSCFEEVVRKVKDKVFTLSDLADKKILSHEKTIIVEEQHVDFQYLWGKHQQKNASLIAAALNYLTEGKKTEEIRERICTFKGIWRRMEYLKTTEKGAQIFSDYGHVASSIEVGYHALRERFPDKRLIAIFQPHQMQRILAGWHDFPAALQPYEKSYLYDIYAARERIEDFAERFRALQEEEKKNVPLEQVEDLGHLFAQHTGSDYLTKFEQVEAVIEKAGEEEIIVVYSAGDIDFALRKYLKLL
ncbi:MAG: cyanophycin synthetase [Candidatus Absconditabacteria bacterium]|nr:cyanophycin synthetase [Candidatus Absconditabacteria bacterium]MDD3868204.1 cyanophycin synthetase [Candidatus Absconditabacteria bacterium]MDD4714669.1 cyanophycin synthetase [Candidatus Absconditabacteria bacterium]